MDVSHFSELSVIFCPSRKDVFSLLVAFLHTAYINFSTVCCGNKSCRGREISVVISNTRTLVPGLLLSFCVVLYCLQIVTNCTVPVYSKNKIKIIIS